MFTIPPQPTLRDRMVQVMPLTWPVRIEGGLANKSNILAAFDRAIEDFPVLGQGVFVGPLLLLRKRKVRTGGFSRLAWFRYMVVAAHTFHLFVDEDKEDLMLSFSFNHTTADGRFIHSLMVHIREIYAGKAPSRNFPQAFEGPGFSGYLNILKDLALPPPLPSIRWLPSSGVPLWRLRPQDLERFARSYTFRSPKTLLFALRVYQAATQKGRPVKYGVMISHYMLSKARQPGNAVSVALGKVSDSEGLQSVIDRIEHTIDMRRSSDLRSLERVTPDVVLNSWSTPSRMFGDTASYLDASIQTVNLQTRMRPFLVPGSCHFIALDPDADGVYRAMQLLADLEDWRGLELEGMDRQHQR